MTAAFDALLSALAGIPDLDGAACIGMWAAFDPPEPGEAPADIEYRHSTALHLCRTYPAPQRLPGMARWVAKIQTAQRGYRWPHHHRPTKGGLLNHR